LLSAFLNRRNSGGDTALHLAVKFGRISTIDWLLDNGAMPSLDMLNNKNYTPVTLAVRQGDVGTFKHILDRQRVTIWAYGHTRMAMGPLSQVIAFPHVLYIRYIAYIRSKRSRTCCIYSRIYANFRSGGLTLSMLHVRQRALTIFVPAG
jgi:ankyrin repeat protein